MANKVLRWHRRGIMAGSRSKSDLSACRFAGPRGCARSSVDGRVYRQEQPDELQLFFAPRFRAGANEGYSVKVDGALPKVRTPLRSQDCGRLGLTPKDFDCVEITILSKANSLVGAIIDHVSLLRLQCCLSSGTAATRMRSTAFLLCAASARGSEV